jgi:hypothetical protein
VIAGKRLRDQTAEGGQQTRWPAAESATDSPRGVILNHSNCVTNWTLRLPRRRPQRPETGQVQWQINSTESVTYLKTRLFSVKPQLKS